MDTDLRIRSKTAVRLLSTWVFMVLTPVLGAQTAPLPEEREVDAVEQPQVLKLKFDSKFGEQEAVGEVVAEYEGGSLLFLGSDGQLWSIYGTDIISREEMDGPMQPMTKEEIYEKYKEELPPGFLIRTTKHYVIIYNTSDAYAQWAGELFERVYRTFYNYWGQRDFRRVIELEEPRFPLVALVFRDRTSYLTFAERQLGEEARAMIGFYNQESNRMVSYDLTGANATGGAPSSKEMVNRILSRPGAERTVATVVHEAVHQISYNSGLQVRLAANPRWVSEGMAMFFESPKPNSPTGWAMGNVNIHNYKLFAQYTRNRPADSLVSLITSDSRMLDSNQALYAYPESWALTDFLIRKRKKEYAGYLEEMSSFKPHGETTERERIDLFKKHFGEELGQLERSFMAHMRAIRIQ